MAPPSSAVATATLLAAVAAAAVAAPATAGSNTTAVARPPPAAPAAPGPPRKTRSCDPTIVLCVNTDVGYSPSFQEPRFYSAAGGLSVRRLPYPVVGRAPLLPSFRLAPPPVVPIFPPPVVPVLPPPMVPVIPPPVAPVLPPPVVPVIPSPAVRVIQSAVRVIQPPSVQVIRPPSVQVIHQPAVSVVHRPYPVAPRPYVTGTRLFPTYPATVPRLPARTDIRSFYQSAVLVGDGVVHLGARTAELICDFTTNGPYPSSDILADVVWQRVGTNDVYLNTPMTSGSENVLYCPRDYVMPPPVNYDFNVVGTRTSLVIQNVGPRDYGTYRCYATRVNRLNPDDRHPVYMEIRFTGNTPRTGLVG